MKLEPATIIILSIINKWNGDTLNHIFNFTKLSRAQFPKKHKHADFSMDKQKSNSLNVEKNQTAIKLLNFKL